MLRTKSVSSLGSSSVLTGDSLQMAIEGQWDETVSLTEIHQGIVQYLTLKLEKLKHKYINLKFADETKKERMMKKIVAARVSYQRYMNVTKDVLKNCEEFMRVRRDTPGSRLAFIRHAQDYFSQAREFIKMDITLKKLSPALLNYVQPKTTDSPNTYRRKRDMCKAMSLVIQNDKGSLSVNGPGKTFRARYAQQNKFINQGFPDSWIQYFPTILQKSLDGVTQPLDRWLVTIMYSFSKHCSEKFIQHGYCSGCCFPIINQRNEGMVGGKLYCHACRKEIEWTYYMSPRTICIIIHSFHPSEIQRYKEAITKNIYGDSNECYFEDVLDEYIFNTSSYIDLKPAPKPHALTRTHETTSGDDDSETELPAVEEIKQTSPASSTSSSDTSLDEIPVFNKVLKAANELMSKIFNDGNNVVDLKNAKETYQMYKSELIAFEGKEEDNIPRGLLPKIERYITHYYKLPSKDDIRKLGFNEKGEREGTSRKMIYDALNELSQNKYCYLVSKIASKLWGSQHPNFRGKYLDILRDCVVQKEIFNRMSNVYGRKSNLNQRLILMFVSQRNGYKWTEEDFRVNFSPSTITKQLEILKELFEIIDGVRPANSYQET